jgi:hypothetical protein
MGIRGRKSAEELNLVCIDVQSQRLKPPTELNERETEIFHSVVDSVSPQHFVKSDLPLLVSFCTAYNLSRWHAHELNQGRQDHHKPWLDCTKLCALLSGRLRLAPSTRYDARQAERNSSGTSADAPRPWDRISNTEE